MNKSISVRQASMADEAQIEEFYNTAFEHAQFKYPDRWIWLYKQNPFLEDNRSLPIWLAVDQNRVVGMSCLMPQLFWIKEHIAKVSWCIDFRVLPEYRRMGLGKRLERARQESGNTFTLASSDASVVIKKKLGYLSRPNLDIYLHARRFDPGVLFNDLIRYLRLSNSHYTKISKLSQVMKLPEILSALLQVIFKYKQYRAHVFTNNKISMTFKPVSFFPKEVDSLWNDIKEKYSLAVIRDSRYLNWKFVEQPYVSYQRYLAYMGTKLCGVLIFRKGRPPELPVGFISEIFTSQSSDILRQMLSFAVSTLYRQGSLMIRSSSSTEERSRVLSSLGFNPIQRLLPAFSFNLDNAGVFADIALKGDWLMGLGDQDLDEYMKASHPSLKNLISVILGRTPGDSLIKTFH